jgi:ABC-type glycerol-3-phosphate transport system permease component
MDKMRRSTIDMLASRSNFAVMAITLFFALTVVALDMMVTFRESGNPQMFCAVWIPFCFLTIPTIHFMAREIRSLQKRVEAIEQGERHEG